MCHATAVSPPVPHPLPLHSLRATMFITPPPAAPDQLFVLDWTQSVELTDKLPNREDTELFCSIWIVTTEIIIGLNSDIKFNNFMFGYFILFSLCYKKTTPTVIFHQQSSEPSSSLFYYLTVSWRMTWLRSPTPFYRKMQPTDTTDWRTTYRKWLIIGRVDQSTQPVELTSKIDGSLVN